ncbi:MAG: chromosomal replication initiator protein DnaA [Firmicutes bacterium]|nr:chromosomal replication initiator protein DnaA [Bacillota bacterium]
MWITIGMDINEVWKNAQRKIADKVSSISFDLWIKTLEVDSFADGEFILVAHSSAAKQMALNDRHYPHIDLQLREFAPIIEKVTIIDALEREQKQAEAIREASGFKQEVEIPKKNAPLSFTTVNPTKTFKSFVVGKSNEFVAAAAEAVAKNPGKKINPLFIYGGSGLGKTHLLNAIANEIQWGHPQLRVALATCEKFTNDYVEALRNKTVSSFRAAYRDIDVLLIDDIQFIENKVSTQEEFFHTFNDLTQNGRQVVLASDRHADKLTTLEGRMRSRFKSGLIQDITSPDVEMRIAILEKKAQEENNKLPSDVVGYLAQKACDADMNVREMEAILLKVLFFAELKRRDIPTLDDCVEALKDMQEDIESQTTAATILDKVCRYFNIDLEEIMGKRRNREFVEPRMVAIYLICEVLNIPLVNIGQLLGGRDHTTIMHSRNKIASQLKTDARMKRIIEDLTKMIS